LGGAMDSFKIHSNVIADYRGYIESFINIRDQEILAVVQKALSEGRLWPEPLIQFNPSYKITGDLASVVASEKLHPLLTDIFKGYRLYQHQMEALRLGTAGSDFVVTSGTGSGKSLTYIGTIFDRLLKNPQPGKVSAVIDYEVKGAFGSKKLRAHVYLFQNKQHNCIAIHYITFIDKDSARVDQMIRDTLKWN
jgi:ATP-dependent helicase YprA (DUF1998 family)